MPRRPQINMDFIFIDAHTNETIAMEGVLQPVNIPDHVLNQNNNNNNMATLAKTTTPPNVLEDNGPLFYVIAVIIV